MRKANKKRNSDPHINLAEATATGEMSGTPSCWVVPVVPKQKAAPRTARIPARDDFDLSPVVLIEQGYS
jgi:hypothetical protein